MTKLMEWLTGLSVYLAVYLAIITQIIRSSFIDDNFFAFQISPIILVGLFGIYSVFTVLYRTFTIQDCKAASDELLREIKEARTDLALKGMKFSE